MLTLALGLFACTASVPDAPSLTGPWRAVLDTPGGPLPFGLEVRDGGATLLNGPERIAVDATVDRHQLVIDMGHYDARIEAARQPDGSLVGRWTKQKADRLESLPFTAAAGALPRFPPGDPPTVDVSGRWAVDFSSADEPAVARFANDADGIVTGTFLTALGDYRFLEGRMSGRNLELSVFDGAHAFLFRATVGEDGALAGDFWSGSAWHETWRATRDDAAALPDAFAMTRVTQTAALDALAFPDLEGTPRTLSDPAFAGKARILQVFGSWCPNCVDETRFLAELHDTYGPQGLSILGLAFEVTPDVPRSIRQVRRFQARHGADWPVLIAGTADKTEASARLPILDRVRAYPTTIFLDRHDRVRAVHTGFAGPAAPEEHATVRAEFIALIEELLAES